ncbi:MAG TPA: NADH-quinone oxidoreductase subunit N [Candidatus Limnocylindrales bacterium]|nr:NADH-quinone oxidoreductase subunit N [Candidatus Limnocylindrales bacterium]
MIDLSGVGVDYGAILPEIVVVTTMIVVLILELIVPPTRRRWLAAVSVLGLLGALVATIPLWGQHREAFSGTVAGDSYAAFFNVILLGTAIATVLISPRVLRAQALDYGEYYVLLLGATAGMLLLAAATSLMTIFLGIELLSIALYVMAGFARRNLRSQEAAMKYLLLGGFASGFLLYGMALIYGATGSTTLRGIAQSVAGVGSLGPVTASGASALLLIGVAFLAVGLAFKASAAPFHMWTPDVYQGSPTVVTTFMSVATKAAAFAAVGRVFIATFPSIHADWYVPLAGIAIFSLGIGNFVAITQTNLKRLLAYSGIAQAGYILLGILPGTQEGLSATLFYVAAYAVMNFGAFAVVTAVEAKEGEGGAELGAWTGLFYRRPLLAATMTVFMLSLAGIPPTVGFFAKLFVFRPLVEAGLWAPLGVAIVTTVISFYYYLRVVVVMLTAPEEAAQPVRVPVTRTMGAVLLVAALATVVLGILPTVVFDWARAAAGLRFF